MTSGFLLCHCVPHDSKKTAAHFKLLLEETLKTNTILEALEELYLVNYFTITI